MKNDKKKILFITPNQFGYSVPHYFWCKYLNQNFQITYLCFKNNENEFCMDDIDINYIRFHDNKFKRVLEYYKNAFKVIKRNDADIIFVVQYKLDFILKLLFPFRNFIFDIRTGGVFDSKLARMIHDFQLKVSGLIFNHTTILSDGLRRKLKISKRKSSVIPLGAEVISITNKNFNKLRLFYIGVFSGRKIEKTIEGFYKFQKEFPDSTYTIIGFGYNDEEILIQNKIMKFGLEKHVHLLGRKSHQEAIKYFDECNVGVSFVPITSYYDHQPPTKNYEYLLSGMACIATATKSNKEIISGDNGVIIKDTSDDFYKGLKILMANHKKYNSEIIRKSVENNLWENIVKTKLYPILKNNLN